MNNEELKIQVGGNIARLRKEAGLTQAELGEKLSYTDKAVSKWERGESMPDVLTLMQLAEAFGTDLDTVVGFQAADGEPQQAQENPEQKKPGKPRRLADHGVIQKLSSILVWFVALFVYVVADAFGADHPWMVYVAAVPANAIVLLSLRSAWRVFNWNKALISVIMWGSLVFIDALIWLSWHVNVWRIFLLGALGQAAIILWFQLFPGERDE